jgi:ornithine cyclodeaminase/alanine dehydrogenase-like protein (mu-crystallin family)
VEHAFRLYGEGKTQTPGILGVHAATGGFHIKAGVMDLDRFYFAAKVNANFPMNQAKFGLPLIQGLIILCDADNGYPLAVMDSIVITILRTAAATAVAAKYLARPDSGTVTICGCGNQGRISLRALAKFFSLQCAFVYDVNPNQARALAEELAGDLSIEIKTTSDLAAALNESDICVTCTPAKQFFLKTEYVRPGTFVAAVGADSEDKQELEPALLRDSRVVVDLLAQCSQIGELHHAIDAGVMDANGVYAELGEIVAGIKPGRTSHDQTIIFDSTGMALQDVVSAAAVYRRAEEQGMGSRLRLID